MFKQSKSENIEHSYRIGEEREQMQFKNLKSLYYLERR